MTTSTPDNRRSTGAAAALLLLAGLLSAMAVLVMARQSAPLTPVDPSQGGPAGAEAGQTAITAATAPNQTPQASRGASHSPAADPRRVRIPVIGVDATTIPLGLRPDGTIEVPTDFDQTGWWADGPEPGEPGPAVVLGHVDSIDGPAVFSRLADLNVGDVVHVDREDGTTISYRVDRTEQHPKDDFPTDAVYGRHGDESVLRLVTCGGWFDRNARSYVDNIIVFASLITS